jgi:dolichol-phosphate mannosyltransferase
MISTETWPQPAAKAWVLAQRFQKFIVVGCVGLAVNQALLFALRDGAHSSLVIASPVAIFISMVATFLLNEHWTWHDRGSGPIVARVLLYFPINTVGLIINFGVLYVLVHSYGWHYLVANLFGAGCAAVWNFVVNNLVTWRD